MRWFGVTEQRLRIHDLGPGKVRDVEPAMAEFI